MAARSLYMRAILGLGLVVLAFLPAIAVAVAPYPDPTVVTFPWVPNGAMLGTMGPFYGAITVQNLESAPVVVHVQATAGGAPVKLKSLPAHGSFTISPQEIGVPAPGSGVWVAAVKDVDQPARVAATQKIAAPVGPHVPEVEARTSDVHRTVDGHAGFTERDASKVLVLPIVQTNSGWNTRVHVMYYCCGPLTQEDITIELRAAGGGEPLTITRKVSYGNLTTFDLLDLGIPPGFVGSAIVRSEARILAVAERYKDATNMLIINPAKPRFDCDSPHVASLVFDDYHHWNTGISIANLGNVSNDVSITIYRGDGTVAGLSELTIPANGMDYVYTPAGGAGDGFAGAAIIAGSQHLCAVVDEVKYTGDQTDVGHAMSYQTIAFGAIAGEEFALPLAQTGNAATGQGDTTGIQMFNPGESGVYANVTFFTPDGAAVGTHQFHVPAKQSQTAYAMALDLANDFQGSALVEVYGGDGEILAISNNVNYAVQFDGSTSFSLMYLPLANAATP